MKARRLFYFSLAALALSVAFAVGFQVAPEPAMAASDLSGPSVARQLQEEFAAVAEKVNPTVVNIDVTKSVTETQSFGYGRPQPSPFQAPPGFEDFFNAPFRQGPRRRGVPRQPVPREAPKAHGLGSGVIIDADNGYILTNNHVVADAEEIGVTLLNKKRHVATLVGTDPRTDLAVIKIDADGLHAVEFGDSDKLKVGHWVMAFGQPQGLGYTVTTGIVSAKGRVNLGIIGAPGGISGYEDFIQTDAAINPGNSGGPLTDLDGLLVGINTAIATNGRPQFMGIGFCIPSNMAKKIADQLISNGEVVRGWFGVSIGEFTDQPAEITQRYSEDTTGAYVNAVTPGEPAAKAGLREGDVIVMYGGKKVEDVQHFRQRVADTSVGETIDVEVLRPVEGDVETVTLQVTVGKQPDKFTVAAPGAVETKIGLYAQTLNDDMAQFFGFEKGETGALVAGVLRPSRAADADLRSGDLITEVRYKGEAYEVASARDLVDALDKIPGDEAFAVRRKRNGVAEYVPVP